MSLKEELLFSDVYSHHRAGVAALLAAFPDKERSVRLPEEQLLRLRPVQVPDEPALLVVVRQVLVLFAHKVTSAPTWLHNKRKNNVSTLNKDSCTVTAITQFCFF